MPRKTPTFLLLIAVTAAIGLSATAGATERVIPAGEFELADHEGKVVVVDFWASWCPPCRESMPFLSAMQEKYGDQGLVTVAVNVDQNPKAAKAMIAALHDDIVVVMDGEGELAKRYAVRGLPTAIVIGRDGEVVDTHTGFHPSQKKQREQELCESLGLGESS